MSSQTYLVTGGARGLGKGLVATLLQRSNSIVIAAVRDPNSSNAKDLFNLPTANGSKVIVVKIDSESDTDAAEAVATLQSKHCINKIDVVIANAAALSGSPAPASSASISDFRRDFQVNAMAPLALFQATWPLLQKSERPVFVGISTCLATFGKMEDFNWPMVSYGGSKAAMNYIVRKIHFEEEALVAFVVHPGWVQTDSGNGFAKANGRDEAPDTVEDSVNFILEKIDASSKANISGTFQYYGLGDYEW